MLPEEVHLPRQLLEVECDLEADRALGRPRRLALQDHELIQGLAIELFAPRRARLLQGFLQREVAQVFLKEDAAPAVDGADLRHGQAPPRHEVAYHDEGQMLGMERLGVERDDGVVVTVDEAVGPPGPRVPRGRAYPP